MGSPSARSPHGTATHPDVQGRKISDRVMNRRQKGRRISGHSPQGKGMDRTEATMGAVKKFFDDRKNTSQPSRLYAFLRWPACPAAFIMVGINGELELDRSVLRPTSLAAGYRHHSRGRWSRSRFRLGAEISHATKKIPHRAAGSVMASTPSMSPFFLSRTASTSARLLIT